MKTSLGDDRVFIYLDYDAVKEVVQNSSIFGPDYERPTLRKRKRNEKFTLRSAQFSLIEETPPNNSNQ